MNTTAIVVNFSWLLSNGKKGGCLHIYKAGLKDVTAWKITAVIVTSYVTQHWKTEPKKTNCEPYTLQHYFIAGITIMSCGQSVKKNHHLFFDGHKSVCSLACNFFSIASRQNC